MGMGRFRLLVRLRHADSRWIQLARRATPLARRALVWLVMLSHESAGLEWVRSICRILPCRRRGEDRKPPPPPPQTRTSSRPAERVEERCIAVTGVFRLG